MLIGTTVYSKDTTISTALTIVHDPCLPIQWDYVPFDMNFSYIAGDSLMIITYSDYKLMPSLDFCAYTK